MMEKRSGSPAARQTVSKYATAIGLKIVRIQGVRHDNVADAIDLLNEARARIPNHPRARVVSGSETGIKMVTKNL